MASLFDVSLDHGASAPARPITAPIMTPFFNLPIAPSGHSVRHGKTRSPKTDLTTLLKMRRATQVHHEHARPSDRANVSHVRLPVRQQNLDFREGVRPPQRGPLSALAIAIEQSQESVVRVKSTFRPELHEPLITSNPRQAYWVRKWPVATYCAAGELSRQRGKADMAFVASRHQVYGYTA